VVNVGAQFCDLVGTDHALEDIEAVLPVSLQDVGMKLAIRIETDGAAIADLPGQALALQAASGHVGSVLGPRRPRRRLGKLVHRRLPAIARRVGPQPTVAE
jgi:hypothetical protein